MSKTSKAKRVQRKRQRRKAAELASPHRKNKPTARRATAAASPLKPNRFRAHQTRALLGSMQGCADCPLDVAVARDQLTVVESEALDYYRGVYHNWLKALQAPTLQSGGGGNGPPVGDEGATGKTYGEVRAALNGCHPAEITALNDMCARWARPLSPREVARLKAPAATLMRHIGLDNGRGF